MAVLVSFDMCAGRFTLGKEKEDLISVVSLVMLSPKAFTLCYLSVSGAFYVWYQFQRNVLVSNSRGVDAAFVEFSSRCARRCCMMGSDVSQRKR